MVVGDERDEGVEGVEAASSYSRIGLTTWSSCNDANT